MKRKNLIDLLRAERGIALPVALAVLFVVAGLATVAASQAIVSTHQSQRDRYAKSAIQAAQSGLATAIYETNMMQPGSTQCVVKDPTTSALSNAAVLSDGYCTPLTETLGDNETYSVRVSQASTVSVNGQNLAERQVVSTGNVNGVKRRATVTIDAATGTPLFPTGYAMVARDSIAFKNNLTVNNGGLGSNGSISIKNNGSVCGNVTPGPGKTFNQGNNFTQCSGFNTNPAIQPFPFQPVDTSGAAATNDNGRITNAVAGSGTPTDTCSQCSKISWNATTRVLNLTSNSVLTLTGNIYLVCSLTLGSNAQLKIAARTTPLYFYIDTPEHCGGSGMGSVTLDGQILNVNSNPATFVLLVAGSATIATSVGIADNAVTAANAPMAIYAPNSTVNFKNNLDWAGALVAKTITIKNNATISYDSRVSTDITLGNPTRFYESQAYKECSSDPPTSTPNSGC